MPWGHLHRAFLIKCFHRNSCLHFSSFPSLSLDATVPKKRLRRVIIIVSYISVSTVHVGAASVPLHTDEVLADSFWNSTRTLTTTLRVIDLDNDVALTTGNFSQFYEAGTFMELRTDFHGQLRSSL